MAAGELDVEVGNQRVDVVVPLHLEAERGRERQVFGLHCVDVHLLDKKDNKMPSDQMFQVSFSHPLPVSHIHSRSRERSTYPDETGVADQLLGVHHIHQGLLDRHLLDAGHIKTVHVLPPWQRQDQVTATMVHSVLSDRRVTALSVCHVQRCARLTSSCWHSANDEQTK